MSRKFVLLILISSLFLTVFISRITFSQSLSNNKQSLTSQSERVHNLDTGLNYTTIQEAINADETKDGHTIFVEEGTYYEHVVVTKSLSLIGENSSSTIIDGFWTGTIVDIEADNVVITNFSIANGEQGVKIIGFSNNTVRQNNINNTHEAILLSGGVLEVASNNTVSDNFIVNNICGINLVGGENNTITGNTITLNQQGMVLKGDNNIIHNIVNNNFFGVLVGKGCKLRENEINENQFNFIMTSALGWFPLGASQFINDIDISNKINGRSIYYLVNQTNLVIDSSTHPDVGYLALINCTNVTARNLNLTNNGDGVLIVESVNCTIEKCLLRNNMIGITAYYINETSIIDNNVSDNYHGISLIGYYNTLANNTITNNTLRLLPYRWPDKWPSLPPSNYIDKWIRNWLIHCSGGIYLFQSFNSTLSNNTLIGNEYGILIHYDNSFNVLKNNNMTENVHNFGMEPYAFAFGENFSAVYNDIDASNTVDGKPIYYWIGKRNLEVPADAGYVALINCTDMVVKDLELKNNMEGIVLVAVNNTVLSNNTISSTKYGIYLRDYPGNPLVTGSGASSINNTIIRNHITDSGVGVCLRSTNNSVCKNLLTSNLFAILSGHHNTIAENTMMNNTKPPIDEWILGYYPPHWNVEWWRFYIDGFKDCVGIFSIGSYNVITENNIANNDIGIELYYSSNNYIRHNNFIDNTQQVHIYDGYASFWDDRFEGNYWSDYDGADTDHDGIGDSWYEIYAINIDHNPLMGMFHSFNTSLGKHVNVISNSTIESFEYFETNSTIRMYVSYESPLEIITFGFCRVCIPHELMNVTSIQVIIDDGATTVLYPNYTLYDNTTHRWIYLAYEHSTHKITIIPEFPSILVLPLFIIATLLAAIVYRRKHTIQ